MEQQKYKLPTLAELHETDPQIAYKMDQLNLLLSAPPRIEWIKKHPIITTKVNGQVKPLEYLPEGIVRMLLRKIFKKFKEEILREGSMFNSAYAVVRVHYYNPVTEEWEFTDGVGAVGMQTDKDEAAGNMAKIKSDAVMKALPSAASYAFKNACKKLGPLFGGELNKNTMPAFTPTHTTPAAAPEPVVPAVETARTETQPVTGTPPFSGAPNFSSFGTSSAPAAASTEIQF